MTQSHEAIIGASGAGPVPIDIERLIGSHAAIIANSGGGKSGLVRRLLESTHGQIQHIILDIEDEFYTLREQFDYVIAGGDGGDIPATVEGAKALALGALQHGFSLIVQLNDLGAAAPAFVAAFLDAMIAAPRDLWHPALVVIDEAQRFAPSDGSTDASAAVKALTGQGRKRGFTAVLASLRITRIHHDVRGDINNWMLGRVGQTLDRNVMGEQLGFTQAEARAKFKGMASRSFWGIGPAIADEPLLFASSDTVTTIPKPGHAKLPTPPAPEAMREILAGLVAPLAKSESSNDLPATDISAEILKRDREIAGLRGDVRAAEQAYEQQLVKVDELHMVVAAYQQAFTVQAGMIADIEWPSIQRADGTMPHEPRVIQPVVAAPPAPMPVASKSTRKPAAIADGLTPSLQRVIDAIAWWQSSGIAAPTNEQVGFIAGYSPSSGNFGNLRSRLRSAGLIDYPTGGDMSLTATGMAAAVTNLPKDALTHADFHSRVRDKLRPAQIKMLDVILASYPASVAVEQLADATGYSATSGNFGNLRSSLKSIGLIDYPVKGHVRAADWLFP